MSSVDVELHNTESNIRHLEELDSSISLIFTQHYVLRILYKKNFALLRQNSVKWAQRAKLL